MISVIAASAIFTRYSKTLISHNIVVCFFFHYESHLHVLKCPKYTIISNSLLTHKLTKYHHYLKTANDNTVKVSNIRQTPRKA